MRALNRLALRKLESIANRLKELDAQITTKKQIKRIIFEELWKHGIVSMDAVDNYYHILKLNGVITEIGKAHMKNEYGHWELMTKVKVNLEPFKRMGFFNIEFKTYKCSKCGAEFYSQDELTIHEFRHD